jgi:hypothetical protein
MGNTTDKIKKGIKDTAGAVKRGAEKAKDAAVRGVDKSKDARMAKKLMRLRACSISGALQDVHDTASGLHALGLD